MFGDLINSTSIHIKSILKGKKNHAPAKGKEEEEEDDKTFQKEVKTSVGHKVILEQQSAYQPRHGLPLLNVSLRKSLLNGYVCSVLC